MDRSYDWRAFSIWWGGDKEEAKLEERLKYFVFLARTLSVALLSTRKDTNAGSPSMRENRELGFKGHIHCRGEGGGLNFDHVK